MNALKNMRSTKDLDDMSIEDIIALDLEEIKILYEANVHEELNAKSRKKKMQSALFQKLDANLIGTTKKDGIKLTVPKTVKWKGLKDLYAKIKAEGGNPDVYIQRKISYSVKEVAYASWPQDIKSKFTPLRTVNQGAMRVEFYDDV